MARHGRTLGGCRRRDARRGTRLVPLHGNSPLEVPGRDRLVPVGIAVAVMPCGAWDFLSGGRGSAGEREKTGGRVAPCFLRCWLYSPGWC